MVARIEFGERLQALKVTFEDGLPERFEKIRKGCDSWIANDCDLEGLQVVHLEAHCLSGSAGSFGYDDLGTRARELDVYVQQLLDGASGFDLQVKKTLETMLNHMVQASKPVT